MNSNEVIKKINDLKPTILDQVTQQINTFNQNQGSLDDYEIVWKQLQDMCAKEIESILKENFPDCEIIIPKSKSTYPDIKMIYGNKLYAIDIKSNEDQKQPWFDIGRLDTFIDSRINVYEEEWELVIRYDSESGIFLKAYFCLLRHSVGIREECNGVKYRPYDGKIRPKSWNDFDNEKVYWDTKEDFRKGIKNSQINRWKNEIKNNLIPILNKEEKNQFKELFD